MLFEVTKQVEHGTVHPVVARLTVQPQEILNHTGMKVADQAKFIQLSVELSPRLLRCCEIEQRVRQASEECRARFRPPAKGAVAVETPQVPNLRAECENFLYEAKNYLRDILKLVNLLWGTEYEDASEWVQGKKGRPSVQKFITDKFGENHVNARFIRQYQTCIEPFPLMRDGVEHPKTSKLDIKNYARAGNDLLEPTWSLETNGKAQYQPLPILEQMARAIHNLLILAEDMLVMWAQANLVAPQLVEVRVVPEPQRNAQCPVKYRIRPTDSLMQDIAGREEAGLKAMVAKC